MWVAASERGAPRRCGWRPADHQQLRHANGKDDVQRRSLDARPGGPAHLGMLMLVLVIGGRDDSAGIMRIGRRVVRRVLVLPMMCRSVRHRFAGDGECDDREQRGEAQPRERGAGHGAKLTAITHRRDVAPASASGASPPGVESGGVSCAAVMRFCSADTPACRALS